MNKNHGRKPMTWGRILLKLPTKGLDPVGHTEIRHRFDGFVHRSCTHNYVNVPYLISKYDKQSWYSHTCWREQAQRILLSFSALYHYYDTSHICLPLVYNSSDFVAFSSSVTATRCYHCLSTYHSIWNCSRKHNWGCVSKNEKNIQT